MRNPGLERFSNLPRVIHGVMAEAESEPRQLVSCLVKEREEQVSE